MPEPSRTATVTIPSPDPRFDQVREATGHNALTASAVLIAWLADEVSEGR